MTGRQMLCVERDAGCVYAEGMRNGIRTAIGMMARANLPIPQALRAEHTKWVANAIHYEWRADQGRPISYVESEETYALIHIHLQKFGLEAFA